MSKRTRKPKPAPPKMTDKQAAEAVYLMAVREQAKLEMDAATAAGHPMPPADGAFYARAKARMMTALKDADVAPPA